MEYFFKKSSAKQAPQHDLNIKNEHTDLKSLKIIGRIKLVEICKKEEKEYKKGSFEIMLKLSKYFVISQISVQSTIAQLQ